MREACGFDRASQAAYSDIPRAQAYVAAMLELALQLALQATAYLQGFRRAAHGLERTGSAHVEPEQINARKHFSFPNALGSACFSLAGPAAGALGGAVLILGKKAKHYNPPLEAREHTF
jgi:hypothetical protein